MATPASPNDLTRQQLDELDSLLQRMLALPIHQNELAPAYSPPPPLPELPPPIGRLPMSQQAGWRTDVPAPAAKAPYQSTPAESPVAALAISGTATIPFPGRESTTRSIEPTPAVAYQPPSTTGTLRGVDAPAMPFGYRAPNSAELDAMPEPTCDDPFAVNPFANLPAIPTPVDEPIQSPVPVLAWPLFAANVAIEFVLGLLGPIGSALTRPASKTAIGWLGVLLLLGAGYWTARGMGYVAWPR